MLPLGRKPVLEHVLDELRLAGIRRVAIILSPGKEMIRTYFGDGSRWQMECDYLVQPEMKGLGDAILLAEQWTRGEPALVAFGDCVIESDRDLPTARLMAAHISHSADATVLTQRVPSEKIARYGVMKPASGADRTMSFQVEDIVEKPSPAEAPSDLAVAGRWVVSAPVFVLLKRTNSGLSGELNLTDPIRRGLREGLRVWAVPLEPGEARRDIGGWETYLTAAAEYASRDPEYGEAVRRSIGVRG
jgi:UTP--glucose-1-phosphate uridylyltransferase